MKMLRRLPQILRFIPGTAQDVRAYFLTLQYWLAGSDENVANMVRFWSTATPTGRVRSCAARCRRRRRSTTRRSGSITRARGPRSASASEHLPRRGEAAASVGLLVMRSYVLAGNAAHYDGVIAALEARGPARHPGLRQRTRRAPGDRAYFLSDGAARSTPSSR